MENNSFPGFPLLTSEPQLTELPVPTSSETNRSVSRQKRKNDLLRRKIIHSALRLFSEKGFFETRIPEISAHAKVGVGSLYRYFRNKEDIFNETFRYCIQDFERHFEQDVSQSASLQERFFRFWKGLESFSQNEFDELTLIEQNLSSSFLDEDSMQEADKLKNKIYEYFFHANDKEELRYVFPFLILGSFSGILRFYLVRDKSVDESVLEQSAQILWNGFSRASEPPAKTLPKRSKPKKKR